MHVFRSVVEKNGFCLIPLIQTLKQVDICMVPVGGIYTIDSEKARRMMAQIEPKVIIPMHYRDGEAGVQELAPAVIRCIPADKVPLVLQIFRSPCNGSLICM